MRLLLRELRQTARGLRRAPIITVSAIFCIALGVGATTAIASAIDRALLRPLPFHEPGRLVTVYRTTPHFDTGPFSPPNYEDLARMTTQLEGLAAVTPVTALLSLPDDAVRISVNRASGNLFAVLGVTALHGRVFGEDDDGAGKPPVVVLSEELWRERFGAVRGVVGQAIMLDGTARTVVGILPARFRVPHGGRVLEADAWIPMSFSPAELGRRRSNFLPTMGRLAPGATAASATAEMRRIFEDIVSDFPQLRGESVRVEPLQTESVRGVRKPLLLLLGAVVIVLLIAVTNVASLLLARGVQRRREIAIRAAIGGARWQVVRPILAEAALIIAIGLTLGIALAWIGVLTIGGLATQWIPQLAGLAVDVRIIAFAVILSILVGLACAAVPAWRGASVNPQDALHGGRGGGRGRGDQRALQGLVIAEVALSLMLLIGAGLVMKSFAQLMGNDPGFSTERLLTREASVSAQQSADRGTVPGFLEPALERIRAIPGVREAAAISLLPYENWGWNFNIRYEGQPGDDPTTMPLVENRVVTPSWFAVTEQRVLAGRLLGDADLDAASPAVVVANEALVRRDFPNADPIGKRFHTGDTTFATIVGVVSDIRNFGPSEDPRPEVYWPYRRTDGAGATFSIVVRAERGDPVALAPSVRQAVRSVDAGAAIAEMQPLADVIADSVGRPRFYAILLGAFAAVALVLAVSGIYGVMSYAVAQRTRELGIRTALGSSASRTLRLVSGQGAVLVLVGLGLGLAGGVAVMRLIQSLLYGVSPLDPGTWVLATIALAVVGLAAALVPARRATRVNPLVALQAE